jgi:hypothetical protein
MNNLAGDPYQYELWPGAKETQDAKWKEEEKIWQQFLDKYSNYDREEILEVTLSSIDQLTKYFFKNSIPEVRKRYIADSRSRQEFLNENNGANFFEDKNRDEEFVRELKGYLWQFAKIKNALNNIFANNKPAANKFLDDVLLINYNPTLKSFLFKVIANNKKNN